MTKTLAVPPKAESRFRVDMVPTCWEIKCTHCEYWWPCDTDNFPMDVRGGTAYARRQCKACAAEADVAYRQRRRRREVA